MNFRNTFWGSILIALGGLLLLDQFAPNFNFDRYIFPVLMIVGGGLLIFKDKFQNNNF